MGNFEKLSVLVIVVIIVMILVVALYTWTDKPDEGQSGDELASSKDVVSPAVDREVKERWSEKDWAIDPVVKDLPGGTSSGGSSKIVEPDPDPVIPPPAPIIPEPVKEDEGTWTYEVKEGDTISQICERELGTWKRQKEVMDLNPGLDPLTIRVGQKLTMPPRGRASSTKVVPGPDKPDAPKPIATGRRTVATGDWYVVRRGDTLETIAKRAYGVIDRWPELWARNLQVVKDPDRLEEGTRIYVPK